MKKRKLSLLLTLLTCLMGTNVYAYDIKVENDDGIPIYYNLINDGTELEVTYLISPSYLLAEGDNSFTYRGDLNIPETVTYMGMTRKVTAIGEYAFFRCVSLSSLTIPTSVSFIGENAFSESKLGSVHISSLEAWCKIQFNGSSSNPVSRSGSLYLNGEEVSNLVIPDGITAINSYAFYNFRRIVSVTIPNSVKSIGSWAFCACSNLTSIIIPNSVTSIGESAFRNIRNLKSITIPSSVTYIGEAPFAYCVNLTSIEVESDNKAYDSRDNCNAIIETSTNKLLAGCKNTVIPSTVMSIGSYAFAYCSGFSSLNIPQGVTSIGRYAFYGCSFSYATIPNGMKSIGSNAFCSCNFLKSIDIPNSMVSIGDSAFYNCKNLASMTIGSSVNYIGLRAFEYCDALTTIISRMVEPCDLYNDFSSKVYSNATLYVPRGSLEAYLFKNYWNKFRNIKEGDPNDPNGIANVESLPVLLPGQGGILQVSGVWQGSPIYVYDISGRLVCFVQASSNITTLETTLRSGDVGIVKIGGKTVKVVMR